MSRIPSLSEPLASLNDQLDGELAIDELQRILYATDASVYQERPLGVVFPASTGDIQRVVAFCRTYEVAMIPRAGGTSLAGQCVGNGLVVDVSRYLNKVIDFDQQRRTVTVEPGIIRDELNAYLRPHGLFFAPITSTANRATLGGMVCNNSCGTNSIVYGDSRRYVKAIRGILSDGSEVLLENLDKEQFEGKCRQTDLEGQLYRHIRELLADPDTQREIIREFPKPTVTRRNTGYALDALLNCRVFTDSERPFNFCQLIAGSEGTLLFMTEITLELCPLPPPCQVVVICQFSTIRESFQAVVPIMQHQPTACELMDRIILDCTRDNLKYRSTLEHFTGDPAGVLLVEFRGNTQQAADQKARALTEALLARKLGYAYVTVTGEATRDIWALRSAGLGLLANIPGDAKGVACIEDTAVAIDDLADYMDDFATLMTEFGQNVVYYAHAGAGEIHLRPILNLKTTADRERFHAITLAVARLVKKYRGSLSGEHGDGRVRAPFIPLVVGPDNYARFQSLKLTWDPQNLFNPGKIVGAKPMNTDLRYAADQPTPEHTTLFDFSSTGGILRLAEKCNGSGDCRKLPLSGGTMCPSYQATRQEKYSTRGRANTLRNFLSQDQTPAAFDHAELKEVLDLCISCKGCTSECPSNVDMSILKAEFQYQHQQLNGIPLRSRLFAHIDRLNRLGGLAPGITNYMLNNRFTAPLLKSVLGIAPQRSFPLLGRRTLRQWFRKEFRATVGPKRSRLYFFCDEFTNRYDSGIGIKAIELLDRLGYDVLLVQHKESGRAAISKGLLQYAKQCAEANVRIFSPLVDATAPLVGLEPSAILSFRDEYPKLVGPADRQAARELAANTLLIEEFLAREVRAFHVNVEQFTSERKELLVHGHCHQKALSNMEDVFTILSLPPGCSVKILDTGCCGMAGSFGYEKEHFAVSTQIGELTVFPAVRRKTADQLVVASGTSCRHQVLDGTGVRALHPVEVLWSCCAGMLPLPTN